jgi:hypothetical protein
MADAVLARQGQHAEPLELGDRERRGAAPLAALVDPAIGWAVPISELDQRTPGDLPAGLHQTLRMTSELLFSERSSSIDAMPATVICAGRKFSLVRGVWLDELVAEVDDSVMGFR